MHSLSSGLLFFLLLTSTVGVGAQTSPTPLPGWQDVVRQSPYWVSRGVFDNLVTIRSWVLSGQSFCGNKDRHILFDRRATFLGFISNAEDGEATQELLNSRRAQLAAEGRVEAWVPGASGRIGYPFALSCDQPEADLSVSLARYTGQDESARLWGTWDGMRIGEPDKTVSLHEAIEQVYRYRKAQGRINMPEEVLSTLAGKVLIESGGRKGAHSAADARGIMQLSLSALRDCDLPERFHFHRMAQIDCALRLLDQNHRNFEPAFHAKFGHLPEEKAKLLYSMLLIQAYHGGVVRISRLFTDAELSGAARYFARHHEGFTAGDIALGLIFHNMGRNSLGFASLYYAVDVGIAQRRACQVVKGLAGCEE